MSLITFVRQRDQRNLSCSELPYMVLGISVLVSSESEFVLKPLFIYQYHPDVVTGWERDTCIRMLWWRLTTVFRLHIIKRTKLSQEVRQIEISNRHQPIIYLCVIPNALQWMCDSWGDYSLGFFLILYIGK